MSGVDPTDVVLGLVPVVLAAVLVYGATIGNEDPLSLMVGTFVLLGWIAGLAIRVGYEPGE